MKGFALGLVLKQVKGNLGMAYCFHAAMTLIEVENCDCEPN